MSTPPRTPSAARTLVAMAIATTLGAAHAEAPAPNAGMGYVSVGAQADNQHGRLALSTLSVPVGQHAWVQAGGGTSRTADLAGGRRVGIVTGGAGVAVESVQLTLNTSRHARGSSYRQTDWGSSLDWRHDGGHVGLDVTHRRTNATGTATASDGTTVPLQARLSGTGLGLHGGLDVSEHVSVYGSIARSHYKSTTRQGEPAAPGGLFGSNPLLGRTLTGGSSVVDRDEAALDRSAQVGATYRWSKAALSGEYTAGQLHDNQGTLRSVELKSVIDVAPGWRVAPGLGRGTGANGGQATFASLTVVHGW
jgi:hypothetical protein